MRPRDPADWSGVKELVEGVSIPVYVNGDFYEPSDICHAIDNLNCAGVLLARPLLLNPSLLRFRAQDEYGTYTCSHDRFLTLAETIVEYLNYCVCYELPYQVSIFLPMILRFKKKSSSCSAAGQIYDYGDDEYRPPHENIPGITAAEYLRQLDFSL